MEPTLGEKIKTYRKKMGLTQEELSKEAGLSKMKRINEFLPL